MTELKSITCPKCGSPAPADINKGEIITCVHCETPLVWPDNQSKMLLRSGDYLCPNCGADNDKNRNACRQCGTKLIKECPICRQNYYVGDNYCPEGHGYEAELKKLEEEQLRKQEQLRKEQLLKQEQLHKEQLEYKRREKRRNEGVPLIVIGLIMFCFSGVVIPLSYNVDSGMTPIIIGTVAISGVLIALLGALITF
jgi:hypothetical protein